MSWPDINWLGVLRQIPARIFLGLAMFSGLMWIMNKNGSLSLSELHSSAPTVIVVMFWLSAFLLLASIVEFGFTAYLSHRKAMKIERRPEIRQQEAEAQKTAADQEKSEKARAARDAVIKRMDHLSPEELFYVARSLRNGTQSFNAYAYHPTLAHLIQKGMLIQTAGTYNTDHWPYTFHDFVWEAFLSRKEELLAKHDQHEAVKRRSEARRR